MDKQPSKRRKDVYFFVLLVVLVLLVVWVSTAKGPEGNYYAYVFGYGNTITMMDREVAEVYGGEYGAIITSGVHLVNKEGALVTPVQGGLKMAFKGLTGGDGRELNAGLQGVRLGIKLSPAGMVVLIILLALLTCLIGYRFIRSRKAVSNLE